MTVKHWQDSWGKGGLSAGTRRSTLGQGEEEPEQVPVHPAFYRLGSDRLHDGLVSFMPGLEMFIRPLEAEEDHQRSLPGESLATCLFYMDGQFSLFPVLGSILWGSC